MNHFLTLLMGSVLLAGNFAVQAQFSAPGGLPPGFSHALFDVLAGGPSFSGQATIQVANAPDQAPTTVSCKVDFLQDKMRLEMDSFNPGTNVPAAEAANLKNMQTITILRQDKNRMYLLYPKFRSCVELASSKSTGTDPVPPPVINKNPLGKEVVDDRPCEKCQWNITEVSGEHYDITVWTATNLSSFPVQIRLGPPSAVVAFQTLRMQAPDDNLFEPPAGYTKFQGIQENIMHETQKGQSTNAQ
jgi:hypothetical protein